MPEVAAHFIPNGETLATPDPLWIDHGTAVLGAASEGAAQQQEYTLPVEILRWNPTLTPDGTTHQPIHPAL